MPTQSQVSHPRRLSRGLAPMALAVSLAFGATAPTTADELESSRLEQITARLESLRDELVAVRRDLHRHPEVSGQEARTARVIAERLRKLGLTVRSGVGGHGVVAVVTGGKPGPLIAVRADIDAVFSQDPDPVPFRSEAPGVRHICGHDIHTTIVLALAEGLVAVQDRLPGSVALVFQPAEESATGARAMLADGLLDSISSPGMRPKAFFALHTAPLEVGQIGSRPGRFLAGRDQTTITLRGEGDLDTAATRVAAGLASLSTITFAQALRSTAEGFVFADVSSTDATGVHTISGVLTMTDDRRDGVRSALERIVQAERDRGLDAEFDYRAGWVPGVWNDPELEARARQVVQTTLGDSALVPLQGIIPMFSEDFGAFLDEIRGVMLFLGVSNAEKGIVGMPHSPGYVADEESIFVGARVLAALVLDALDTEG